ncbi:MAG: hypothetical protein KKC75_00445 [Nanoarchaeota archaeon]|nr:hypothetical protein [Nanoarchaeota archaeon]MBU1004657.1 hypothetical protein [Nanoarchaeota archaeon]MBU1946040.1 hypothetical protein [Nanoarchaeota archaeon]
MIPPTRLDYVEFYANKLKEDHSFFKSQKRLIESQLQASSSLFRNKFGSGDDFKIKARKYLKGIGLI